MSQLSFNNTENAFKYKSSKALKKAQFLFSAMSMPTVSQLGIWLTQKAIAWNLPVKGLIKSMLYNQFCGGETISEVAANTAMLNQYNVDVCLDYGVEGAKGEAAFDAAVVQFIDTIAFAAKENNIPFIPLKVTGFADSSLLERLSNDTVDSTEDLQALARVTKRIDDICKQASKQGLHILIDAEESWLQQAVDDLADLMMEKYNKTKVTIFNTFQLYRHDRLAFIKSSLSKAQERGYLLGVKIVRGAYMEKERERAAENGYTSPIQINKEATDKDYNLAIDYCFEHLEHLALFIGTHNESSCLKGAKKLIDANLNVADSRVSFSQLYGMSDNITFNLAKEGFNASKYLPYGPMKDVIPYLMRRANENTSVAGQTNRELDLINKEIQRRKAN